MSETKSSSKASGKDDDTNEKGKEMQKQTRVIVWHEDLEHLIKFA